ncbi:serine hydrolase domain-containing protein [Amycolatopsis jiangsuensis]|uniref:CubicO group peptidase (Beta-lactamase class C family) n=1 Tax=Amycolatopsis jiangsuensis TaxID=1181879 RepID=A0A840J6D3_9PSEU|nr:serine hydrolase domain-containing protein [Amycolatopsis jiangsuensis]MBB4689259.1 CubicO group peptidase (beta-lactamase class C family) [Amycolatopsis jiangsuensis]
MTFDAEKVRDTAAAQIEGDPEGGAALCVVVDGVEVVNEAWGLADAEKGTPYTSDTLQIAQSMGKGVVGAAAALLISRAQLDPDARVASYWPEFGTPDKRDITVAQLLSHQTGLLYLDDTMPLTLTSDREKLAAALVAQAPVWTPGTRIAYSPQTIGNYADFLFERASGQGFAGLLREITDALGIEMYVGLPPAQRHRASRVLAAAGGAIAEANLAAILADPDSVFARIARNIPETLPDPIPMVNGEAICDAFLPAANMFAGTRDFAHLYSALSGALRGEPSPLWSRAAVELATTEVVRGEDAVLSTPTAFALAFQKPSTTYPLARSPRAFGHGGAGGSLAMADPDAGFALCWMTTRYGTAAFDPRQTAVLDAVYSALN